MFWYAGPQEALSYLGNSLSLPGAPRSTLHQWKGLASQKFDIPTPQFSGLHFEVESDKA